MERHFTHLHLHTEFSLLDGAISLDNLVSYGKKHNLKALAITDHGNILKSKEDGKRKKLDSVLQEISKEINAIAAKTNSYLISKNVFC